MTYTQKTISAPDNSGEVTTTTSDYSISGILRGITKQETDGVTILITDKMVMVTDPDDVLTLSEITLEDTDRVKIGDRVHSVVAIMPKEWQGSTKYIDLVIRDYA